MVLFKLFVFVEGEDDERFFNTIMKSKYDEIYRSTKIITYRQLKKKVVNKIIETIRSGDGSDYIFVADMDDGQEISSKKDQIKRKYKSVNLDKIIIVIKEIESWYLAGITRDSFKKLKLKEKYSDIIQTNHITKELFFKFKPNSFTSDLEYKIELLKYFSVPSAKQKNKSFNIFIENYDDVVKLSNA